MVHVKNTLFSHGMFKLSAIPANDIVKGEARKKVERMGLELDAILRL